MPIVRVRYAADIAVVAECEVEVPNLRRSTAIAAARTAFWDREVVASQGGWNEVLWDSEGNQRVLFIEDEAGNTLAEDIDLSLPTTPEGQTRHALTLLHQARGLLSMAGAKRAADKVRLAISSTAGALRHAKAAEMRNTATAAVLHELQQVSDGRQHTRAGQRK